MARYAGLWLKSDELPSRSSPMFRQRNMEPQPMQQGLLFWLFKGGFKASLGTLDWCTSSYGTDFENSGIASPVQS